MVETSPSVMLNSLLPSLTGIVAPPSVAVCPIPPLQDPIAALLTTASSQSLDLTNVVQQVTGSVTFNNGQVTTDFTSPFGSLQRVDDLATLAQQTIAYLQSFSGNLSFTNGFLTTNLVTPNEPLQQTFEFANLTGNLVNSLLDQVSGTFSFASGQIPLDIPTPFGPISGTVGFATGALTPNLTTPFGSFNQTIPFGSDAQIPFTLNIGTGTLAAVVDFSRGLLSADLLPGLPGGEVDIPLTFLAGTVTLNNGLATLNLNQIPLFGNVSTTIDVSQLADDYVTSYLQGLTGNATITAGVVSGTLTGPFGTVQQTVDLPDLAAQGFAFLQQVQGSVTLVNGILTSNLTTPLGDLVGSLDLTVLANEFRPFLDAIDQINLLTEVVV